MIKSYVSSTDMNIIHASTQTRNAMFLHSLNNAVSTAMVT